MAVRKRFSGIVTDKRTDPLRLMVSEGGYFSAVECISDVGTWGATRVGDLVRVTREGPVSVAERPVDLRGTANQLQRVGEDLRAEQTDSHTDWVTLLEVTDLHIPGGALCEVQFVAEVEVVGSAGGTPKQVSLVFNGVDAHDFNIGFATATAWVPCRISTYASGLNAPARFMQLMTATTPTVLSLPVETISSIRVDARTNDTGQGNDIVRVTELMVFA